MTVNRSLFHFSISLLTVCPFSISIFLYLNPFFCHCLPLQFFIFTFSLIYFFLLPSSILLCLSPFLFLSSFFPLFISPLYISVADFFLILPYSLYLPLNRCLCVHPFLFSLYRLVLSILFPSILSTFFLSLFPPFFPPNLYTIILLPSTQLLTFMSPSILLSLLATDGSPGSSEDPLQLHVRLSVSAGPDGLSSE